MITRFQFRLRTLMIVVTFLAAACWVVVDRQRLIHESDAAIKDANDQRVIAVEATQISIMASEQAEQAAIQRRRIREETMRTDNPGRQHSK